MSKEMLLEKAIQLSEQHGYKHITREMIASAACVATGTVTNHLGTMAQMRRTIVRHAVRTGNQRIIAQAVVAQDPYAVKRVPREDRIAALQSVA